MRFGSSAASFPLAPAPPPRWRLIIHRLFSDTSSTLWTIFAMLVFIAVAVPVLRWAVFDGDFAGGSPASCRHDGACWLFIEEKLGQLCYGFYPRSLWWQVDLSLGIIAAGCIAAAWLAKYFQVVLACAVYLTTIDLSFVLFSGSLPGMTSVPVEKWGGLSITLLLFIIGSGISFAFGGLLAMGRRSKRPLIRSVCSVYVEFMRGIPLIAILFIAVVMLPLFLRGGVEGNMFLRVLVGICLYTSAYMAEAIRAGLNAVRVGDREAAHALGLSRWNTEKLIVFPQALIVSAPALVNTMIGLVKDTSLVLIVGMHDFLGSTQLAMTDVAWGNVLWEGYAFAALVYFAICYCLSTLGARIEKQSRRYRTRAG
jgi:general L-amino acid transport system permease protein